eukprot:11178325-Lingulodinium_polyedra.AAC.1
MSPFEEVGCGLPAPFADNEIQTLDLACQLVTRRHVWGLRRACPDHPDIPMLNHLNRTSVLAHKLPCWARLT